jgi:hypothetical protein
MVVGMESPDEDVDAVVIIALQWIDRYITDADTELGSGYRRSVLSTTGIDQFNVFNDGI